MFARGVTPANILLALALLAAAPAATVSQTPSGRITPARPDGEKLKGRTEIESLLAEVRDEQLRKADPERVFKAMRRLGELGSVEAVDDLVRLLTLKRVFDWETPENAGRTGIEETIIVPANRYPAIDALFLIGRPALPALVGVLEKYEGGSLESENAVYTVFAIFRERPSDGAALLRRASAEAASADAARRLLAASENQLFSPQ